MEQYKSEQQERDNNVRQVADLPPETNSAIFQVLFGEGTISISVAADHGTDNNFIYKTLWQEGYQQMPNTQSERLQRARIF